LAEILEVKKELIILGNGVVKAFTIMHKMPRYLQAKIILVQPK
jgi:hypothetical protein